MRFYSLFLIFNLLTVSGWGQYDFTCVAVRLADVITGQPISDAKIELRKRKVDIFQDGFPNVRPVNESESLNVDGTNEGQGSFRFLVPLENDSRKNYLSILIQANGYEAAGDLFFHLDRSEKHFHFEMKKFNLNNDEMEFLEQKIEAEKQILELEKITDPQLLATPNEGENKKVDAKNSLSCNWTIPTQVFVQNLISGYNNTTCSNNNGYTGYINFNEYIAGVVRGEMNGFPLEAMKAQAVAARSYSLKRHESSQPVNCGQAYSSTICTNCTTAANSTSTQIIELF